MPQCGLRSHRPSRMLGSWHLKVILEGWLSNHKLKVIHSFICMRNHIGIIRGVGLVLGKEHGAGGQVP